MYANVYKYMYILYMHKEKLKLGKYLPKIMLKWKQSF